MWLSHTRLFQRREVHGKWRLMHFIRGSTAVSGQAGSSPGTAGATCRWHGRAGRWLPGKQRKGIHERAGITACTATRCMFACCWACAVLRQAMSSCARCTHLDIPVAIHPCSSCGGWHKGKCLHPQLSQLIRGQQCSCVHRLPLLLRGHGLARPAPACGQARCAATTSDSTPLPCVLLCVPATLSLTSSPANPQSNPPL